MPKPSSPLVPFLLRNALAGVVAGWTLLAGLAIADVASLGTLILSSRDGWLALALALAGFGVTFGSLAMGTAVFLLPEEEGEDREARPIGAMPFIPPTPSSVAANPREEEEVHGP